MSNLRQTAIFVFLLLSMVPAMAQSSPNIEWELRRPFKMFGVFGSADNYFSRSEVDRTVWDYRRDLYVEDTCTNDPNPVSCSEKKLGPGRIQKMRQMLLPSYNSENNSHVRDAWLGTAITWNNKQRAFDPTMFSATPRVGIKARLIGLSNRSSTCQWYVDGNTIDEWKLPCNEWLKTINLKRGGQTSTLRVKILDTGQAFDISGHETLVRERLIVGLGDSFASGEGNPDIPVRLSGDLDRDPAYALPKRRDASNMMETDAAQWLDRDCHRSLLGAQQRAAIQFAASRPKEETTFLGFACSGAEILEGIIGPYAGTGDTSKFSRAGRNAGFYEQWDGSQINQAIRALCRDPVSSTFNHKRVFLSRELREGNYASKLEKRYRTGRLETLIAQCPGGLKRPVDAVLLSVGGNDIGFSKIIANVIVEGWFRSKLFGLAGQTIKPEEAKDVIRTTLPGKYKKLDEVLEAHLGIIDPRRVIISTYADPATDHKGQPCGSNPGGLTKGLEAFPARGTATLSKAETRSIKLNVIDPINALIRRAPDRNGRTWTIADGHVQRSLGHGICAEGNLSNADTLSTRDYMNDFNPYALTTRWFRTVNDSYLIQNQTKVEEEIDRTLTSLIADKYLKVYGMIHPNSLGAAANADAYLEKLQQIIPKGG